jgi:phosphodiesterase/alkaline phosphatase D-like protein
MNQRSLKPVLTAALGSLFFATLMGAQVSPTTPKASSTHITEGPATERVDPDFAIIRWTTNNPGGSPVHYGIVHYGTDSKNLTQTAKSPIRLNPGHSSTVFRVRMEGLKPGTTYYYTVASMEANGTSDGVKSAVNHFSTPGAPEPPPASARQEPPRH